MFFSIIRRLRRSISFRKNISTDINFGFYFNKACLTTASIVTLTRLPWGTELILL
ncbi:MAG: hypothetical protein LBV04_05050 [Deferribacteraceae bacterium]|nr:hypothetical protein [Deferribacteraceae bacterium]